MTKNNIKSVSVFCGSRNGRKESYKKAAIELGALIAELELTLVYGGGNVGLMGELATSAQQNGCKITGIIPKHLFDKEVAKANLNELIITKDMHQRKRLMYQKSDAIIVLPGGVGTLDEFFEILTWAQLGLHKKKIVLLNIDNFWNPLLELITHQVKSGFMELSISNLFTQFNSAKKTMDYLLDSNRQLSTE